MSKNGKIIIIGGGAIGCESGYFFASEWGAQVDILEMRDDVCKDSGMSQRMALLPRMKKSGMGTYCSVKVQEVTDKGVKFTDKDGNDRMQEEIQANYDRIRQEVRQIVEDEITRIKNDPELCHLIKEEE